jgi:hypothetical protein
LPKQPLKEDKSALKSKIPKFNFPFSTLDSTSLPTLLRAQTDLHTPKTLARLPLDQQREHTAILSVLRRASAITDSSKRLVFLKASEATHRLPEAVKSTRSDKARAQVESGKFSEVDAMEMGEWDKMRWEQRKEKERRILTEEGDKKVRDKKMASLELGFRREKTMALARREVIAESKGW